MKRVLICGSRDWQDLGAIFNRVAGLGPKDIVIHGGAVGADRLAEQAARQLGHHTAEVRPLWDHFGKRAGHIRNAAMLDLQPDLVLAFQRNGSKGTQGTIDEARKRGVEVEVFTA